MDEERCTRCYYTRALIEGFRLRCLSPDGGDHRFPSDGTETAQRPLRVPAESASVDA